MHDPPRASDKFRREVFVTMMVPERFEKSAWYEGDTRRKLLFCGTEYLTITYRGDKCSCETFVYIYR